MYAVIFTAEINPLLDANGHNEYAETAKRMRQLAFSEDHGCLDFTCTTEGNKEIAISYWPSIEHIQKWKHNIHHTNAQAKGRKNWYKSYKVQVVKLLREYEFGSVGDEDGVEEENRN